MLRYIIERLVALVLTLFIIVSISFCIIKLMPGSFISDAENLSPEVKAAIEEKYHINDPIPVQYGYFLRDIFIKRDLGTSVALQPKVPITKMLADKIPITVQLNFFALFLMIPIGMTLGIIAALKKNKMADHGISTLVILWISIPGFVFAALMQYFLGFKLGWLPMMLEPVRELTAAKFLSMIMPILALSFGGIAGITRYLRAELVGALNSEYMLLAKSKGLTQAQATLRHAIRNSFIPLANIIVPMFTTMMTGSIVIEKIFGIPGMGQVMINSINAKDNPVTIGLIVIYSFINLISVLLVDLSYGIIDPRIRMGGKK